MIQKAGDILVREIRKAIDALLPCVCPLFHLTDNDTPQLLGSSVLIKISDNVFLCTAKHVVEDRLSPLYVNGPSSLEILSGEFYCARHHDLGVLRLTAEQILSLGKYTPLEEDNIANQTQTELCNYVEFIGYPGTRNRVSKSRYGIRSRIYAFGCVEVQVKPEEVRFKFAKTNKDAKTNLRVRSPNLHGVSGGPIMGVSLKDVSTIRGNPHPRLIGIATDYNEKWNEVLGPTTAVLLATIKNGWDISLSPRLAR